MGLLGAAFGLGFVAGPAIAALGALWGPHVPFYIAAAIAFVNAVVAIRRLPETHRDASPVATDVELEAEMERAGTLDGPQPGSPIEASRDRASNAGRVDRSGIVRLITVSFVGMIAFSGFEATFSLLTEHRFGLKLSGTGAVFTAIGLALVVVQVSIIGRVNDRLGESGTLRVGLVCNAAGLALLAVDGGWATAVPSLALLVLGQGLITPTLSSAVAGRAGGERGTWLGWQQSAGGLARVLGPVVAGVLFQQVGVGAPYAVGAVLVLLALSLVPGAATQSS
jgi:predicted MFS family arabinose efflux permease